MQVRINTDESAPLQNRDEAFGIALSSPRVSIELSETPLAPSFRYSSDESKISQTEQPIASPTLSLAVDSDDEESDYDQSQSPLHQVALNVKEDDEKKENTTPHKSRCESLSSSVRSIADGVKHNILFWRNDELLPGWKRWGKRIVQTAAAVYAGPVTQAAVFMKLCEWFACTGDPGIAVLVLSYGSGICASYGTQMGIGMGLADWATSSDTLKAHTEELLLHRKAFLTQQINSERIAKAATKILGLDATLAQTFQKEMNDEEIIKTIDTMFHKSGVAVHTFREFILQVELYKKPKALHAIHKKIIDLSIDSRTKGALLALIIKEENKYALQKELWKEQLVASVPLDQREALLELMEAEAKKQGKPIFDVDLPSKPLKKLAKTTAATQQTTLDDQESSFCSCFQKICGCCAAMSSLGDDDGGHSKKRMR